MNLKINYQNIYIVIFTLFFFLWGTTLNDFNDIFRLIPHPQSLILKKIKLSYLVILLLIPIFYCLIKKKSSFLKEIFNYQKYIIFFILFIIVHFFLVKVYYHETIAKSEIANLIYLFILSIIYCHYRDFISTNFKKILSFYLIILIIFSIYEGSQFYQKDIFQIFEILKDIIFKNSSEVLYDDLNRLSYNVGQCNNDVFLISILRKYLNIRLTNSFYIENSHLAMMSIAVFFSCIYILVQEKKINILLILLILMQVIIVLSNLSTTYFVCYFFSQITLLFFFLKKINIKFWIVTILLLAINSYLFFSDKNCTVKVTDFKVKEVLEEKLVKGETNLTTLIYKRSVILALRTLKDHSLGWGIDGMHRATHDLLSNYDISLCKGSGGNHKSLRYLPEECNDEEVELWITDTKNKKATWILFWLNTKDGLSNFFKMFTEFGIFTFIIFFFFIKYILNIKNINSYNLFIIILFVTICIRGAGYFNGGFIFCLLEFFYSTKIFNEFKFKKLL